VSCTCSSTWYKMYREFPIDGLKKGSAIEIIPTAFQWKSTALTIAVSEIMKFLVFTAGFFVFTSSFVTAAEYSVDNFRQIETCGGIVESSAGAIVYKLGQPLERHEKCIWTILAENRSNIELQVVQDGLDNNILTDRINVYGLDSKHEMIDLATIVAGDRTKYTFDGPLIFVSFTTDLYSKLGTGFLISFQAVGPELVKPFRFNLNHISGPDNGTVRYSPGPNLPELAIFTFNLVMSFREYQLTLNLFQGFYNGVGGDYRYCDYNRLNIYECGRGFAFKRLGLCRYIGPTILEAPSPFIVSFYNSYSQSGVRFDWTI